jgi:hypothetical protein
VLESFARLSIQLNKAGFGSLRDIDETEYESLIEVLAMLPHMDDDPDDLVLKEIRRSKGG